VCQQLLGHLTLPFENCHSVTRSGNVSAKPPRPAAQHGTREDMTISLQPTREASPFEKGAIEKTLGSVATLFAQFVAGYTGRSVGRRGRGLEIGPLWSLPELQALLDEWIVVWQNRPHDALRDPESPKRAFTPNEKYAMLLESCGHVRAPFSGEDYVELLPERWQVINSYGIRINHRTYDDAELTLAEGRAAWRYSSRVARSTTVVQDVEGA